jgi:uncharacterized membrane protein YccC
LLADFLALDAPARAVLGDGRCQHRPANVPTAITVYIVVLAHALGQAAFQAMDGRGIATVIGLVIAALGFVVLRDRRVPEPSTATTS